MCLETWMEKYVSGTNEYEKSFQEFFLSSSEQFREFSLYVVFIRVYIWCTWCDEVFSGLVAWSHHHS